MRAGARVYCGLIKYIPFAAARLIEIVVKIKKIQYIKTPTPTNCYCVTSCKHARRSSHNRERLKAHYFE